jgi:hypothetical protein
MFVSIATVLMIATPMHLSHAATIFIILHNYSLLLMDNVFSQPRIVSPLSSPPNSGINALAIPACINFAISNSVQLAFLLASIVLFIRYMHARLATARVPAVRLWDLHPPPQTRFQAPDSISILLHASQLKHVPQNQNSHPRCSIT